MPRPQLGHRSSWSLLAFIQQPASYVNATTNARMHKVTIREANSQDITTFAGEMKAPTLRGWVGEIDGNTVALGGLAFQNARWVAFLNVTPEGRQLLQTSMQVRKALIQTARMVMNEARKQGVRFVYAGAEMKYPLADKMLERIGFKPDSRAEQFYVWKP